MTTLSVADAPRMVEALKPYVNTLLMAKAYAQLERERVDKIQRKVLAEEVYLMDERWLEHGRDDERITEPDKSHLMCDVDASRYFEKLNAIHLANGFEDAAKGYCPALVAETLERDATHALILSAQEFMPEVTPNGLLCLGLEKYHKFVDLLIGLVVNSPGYTSPLR